jgi:dolichyl-phosphate-mannose-protein mannosyltransferase
MERFLAPGERDYLRLLLAVTLAGALLRLWGITTQVVAPDDYAVALSALNYLQSGQLGPTMWNHPPGLRSPVIFWLLEHCGHGVFALRSASLVPGILAVPLLALVVRRLTGHAGAALVAALFMALEPLAIFFSRQAINDIHLVFFPLLGIYAALRFTDELRPGWLVAAGLAFGLGLATKWGVVLQLAPTVVLALWQVWRGSAPARGRRLLVSAFVGCALVVLPLTIYLVSYAPWFDRGYSLSEFPELQQAMYRETKLHTGYHSEIIGNHRAITWFVMPVNYHNIFMPPPDPADPLREPEVTVLMAVANPLVWLAVLPALLVVARRAFRERSVPCLYLSALFWLSYLPLILTGRPIWVNTALLVLPYALAAVAWVLAKEGVARFGVRAVSRYLAAAVLVFLVVFPLAAGWGTRIPWVKDQLIGRYYDEMIK